VNAVSFSPDGARIVTGSQDQTVRMWDAATRQPVGEPLRGHTSSVKWVSFSPDGTRIATGSEDQTVRVWDAAMRQPSQHSTPFFLNVDSGWVVGPNCRLLFWVPPASRRTFYNHETALVIRRGCPELDLSRMAHGQHWQKC
ncbi:WD40 repeat-like protein, partial [Suillus decipiens]